MVTSLSYTWQDSSALHGCGAQVPTTEDKLFAISCFFSFFLILLHFSTLSMSDELAQDEQDAEDYDLEAMQSQSQMRDDDDDDDAATLVGGRRGNAGGHQQEEVVFEIGDEDDDEEDAAKKRKPERLSGENHGGQGERQGLMAD